jgi:hypothetical protein
MLHQYTTKFAIEKAGLSAATPITAAKVFSILFSSSYYYYYYDNT